MFFVFTPLFTYSCWIYNYEGTPWTFLVPIILTMLVSLITVIHLIDIYNWAEIATESVIVERYNHRSMYHEPW